jgi:uncharacterized membrane protein required for colicin V production
MGFIDLVLGVFVGGFVLFGFWFGFIHTLGSLIGTFVGILLATRLIEPVSEWLSFLGAETGVGKVILFVVLFLLITRLVGLVFWILEKIFGFVKHIPFAKSTNRILGGVFGFIEGVLVVGMIAYYALQVLPADTLLTWLESSVVAEYLIGTVSALQFMFPEGLQLVMLHLV